MKRNYSAGMAEDQKDRYIQYLAEQNQDLRLTGDKQLVIELNINKNGISVSGVTIQGWETQGNGVGRHHHRITKSKGQTCLITRRNTYLIEKGLHVNPFCWYHKTNNYENKTFYFRFFSI